MEIVDRTQELDLDQWVQRRNHSKNLLISSKISLAKNPNAAWIEFLGTFNVTVSYKGISSLSLFYVPSIPVMIGIW